MKKIITTLLAVLMFFAFSGCTPEKDNEPEQSDYIPADSISCDPAELNMVVNDKVELKVTVSPDSATEKGVTFSSTNTSVAMVNENGLVVAIAEGVADIMITAKNETMVNLPVHVIVKAKESDPAPAPTPEPAPEPEPEPETAKVVAVYTNGVAEVNPQYYPVITLYDNGEFSFYENMYEGMVTYLGTYSDDGYELTLYCDYIKSPGGDTSPADLGELKFMKIGDKYLEMHSTAYLSQYDDIFTKDYKEKELAYTYYIPMPGTDNNFLVKLELYTDKSFVLSENYYEGIEVVEGIYYTDDGITYMFNPTKQTNNTGHTYKQFTMKETQTGFELMTDLHTISKETFFTDWINHLSE
ncbi:MAG: Ig-like domain-containing protein [Erysipelotrichaceae bacterium]|nr:Ig-like domain-containing protein [Erysipelotrichaceae bacterium]